MNIRWYEANFSFLFVKVDPSMTNNIERIAHEEGDAYNYQYFCNNFVLYSTFMDRILLEP